MNHNEESPLINLENISFGYPENDLILDNLSFKLYTGDKIGLMAPNGSGKTTLFHIIMGLLKPSDGNFEIFGMPIKKEKDFLNVRKQIGLLFQDADDQLFSPTVLEDVAFGPLNLGKSKEEAIEISKKTLTFLGLSGFEDRITFKLSGGEKRLVSLATVLAMEPKVLLLDEPTTGLDKNTKSKLIDILYSLELSYVLISHEFEFLDMTTTDLYTLENGKMILDNELAVHHHEHVHRAGKNPHRHI